MKTHKNNTKAKQLYLDVMAKTAYTNHQQTLNSGAIKPVVVTKRKEQVKIVSNHRKEVNPNLHGEVQQLFKNISQNRYKSVIDNQPPKHYTNGKKILKDKLKKNPQENYLKAEHERELRSQAERIKNCKSLNQRKKDNTDPIVNPTYFMRDGEHASSVTIENYRDTVIKKNRPASGTQTRTVANNFYQSPSLQVDHDAPMPHLGSVPNYSKVRPSSAKPSKSTKAPAKAQFPDNLPECSFKGILDHIVENKMFRDTDMKVLYVRLCHKYGEDRVDDIWQTLMQDLEA